MDMIRTLFYCLCGFWCLQNTISLKITSLDVPKNAWDAVKLNCKYDLEGGTLYNVKWYKDGVEFFRCLADGSNKDFPLKDIKIYYSQSSQIGSCLFELTALTTRSGGEYTCEVGLDSPTFLVVSKTARLHIIEPSKIFQTAATETMEIDNEASSGMQYSRLASYLTYTKVLMSLFITVYLLNPF